ncbi:YjjG family noncanonical pyrimidine nucleotidase [Cyclobacteriaceae bacterium]|nr:YjjG family noncanonical pyrimidine nucleotidase [Cyclobacteriaceae bacterium]
MTQLFFDLDHTLWDYETNARATLLEMYHIFVLDRFFRDETHFLKTFKEQNEKLWHRYNVGDIDKYEIRNNRFGYILNTVKNTDFNLAKELSNKFIIECPRKKALMPNAGKVLDKLSQDFELGIITNGFDDTQNIKLKYSEIDHYFKWVVTSESSGYRKPAKGIFDFTLDYSGGSLENIVIIGDNLQTDILGAKNAGWKSVWYNPQKELIAPSQLQVHDLIELPALF